MKLAADGGAADLHLSPWRAVYFGVREEAGAFVLEEARDAGLIVEDNDPVLQVEACPGAPDCKSSSVDAVATRVGSHHRRDPWRPGQHPCPGCAKGCARSLPSDLVLAGKAGAYRLIRKATTCGPVERMIDVEEFETLFRGTQDD